MHNTEKHPSQKGLFIIATVLVVIGVAVMAFLWWLWAVAFNYGS